MTTPLARARSYEALAFGLAVATGLAVPLVIYGLPRVLLSKAGAVLAPAAFLLVWHWGGTKWALLPLLVLQWVPVSPSSLPVFSGLLLHATMQEYVFYTLALGALLTVRRADVAAARWSVLMLVLAGGICLLLLGALGLTRGADPEYGPAFLRWAVLLPVAVSVVLLGLVRSAQLVRSATLALVLGSAAFAAIAVAMWASGHLVASASTVAGARLGGEVVSFWGVLYWDPVTLGSTFAVVCPLGAAMLVTARAKWERYAYGLSLCLLLVGVAASGSRGGWIGGAVGLVVAVLLASRGGASRRIVGGIVLGATAVVGFATFTYLSGRELFASRLASLIHVSSDPNFLLRRRMWSSFYREVNDSGLVPHGFYYLGGIGNPHSLYLFIATGTGWLGAAVFVCLALAGARLLWRARSRTPGACLGITSGALGGLVALLVVGVGDAPFSAPWASSVIASVLGVGLAAATLRFSPRQGERVRATPQLHHSP